MGPFTLLAVAAHRHPRYPKFWQAPQHIYCVSRHHETFDEARCWAHLARGWPGSERVDYQDNWHQDPLQQYLCRNLWQYPACVLAHPPRVLPLYFCIIAPIRAYEYDHSLLCPHYWHLNILFLGRTERSNTRLQSEGPSFDALSTLAGVRCDNINVHVNFRLTDRGTYGWSHLSSFFFASFVPAVATRS